MPARFSHAIPGSSIPRSIALWASPGGSRGRVVSSEAGSSPGASTIRVARSVSDSTVGRRTPRRGFWPSHWNRHPAPSSVLAASGPRRLPSDRLQRGRRPSGLTVIDTAASRGPVHQPGPVRAARPVLRLLSERTAPGIGPAPRRGSPSRGIASGRRGSSASSGRPRRGHRTRPAISCGPPGGQKTGFYLDQRDNRPPSPRTAAIVRVLDLFCFTGAFSLNTLRHGEAVEALGVDSSAPAIDRAREHAAINGVDGASSRSATSCRRSTVSGRKGSVRRRDLRPAKIRSPGQGRRARR